MSFSPLLHTMELIDLLENSAAAFPERVSVTHHDRNVTYQQLWQASNRVGAFLAELSLEQGARVAILFENSIEYVIAFFAVSRAGLVAVPLDTSANPITLNNILKDSRAAVLFFQSRYHRHLTEIIGDDSSLKAIISDKDLKTELDGIATHSLSDIIGHADSVPARAHILTSVDSTSELASIFYTSGSTGSAKGVMLSHRNLVSNTLATIEYLKLTTEDSVLVILPFYYIYGNSLLLTHIACGGRLVIDNRFLYPEVVLDTMEQEDVTGFSGVPSNYIILLNKSSFRHREFKALRYFTQAGGAMAPETIQQLMDAFPDKEIFIMYGQTEASPRATWLPPERLKEKLGSIGIPIPGIAITVVGDDGDEVPIGETGEIVISGDNVMLGYWNQPQETDEVLRAGRLHTGDLARQDEDGYLYITGRQKEIIKTGGNRVSAKEVEECLFKHESILESCVFAVPDDLLCEAIKTVVVLKPGYTIDPDAIKDHCRQFLAAYKVPKYVVFADTLPKYRSGKVNRRLLTSRYS